METHETPEEQGCQYEKLPIWCCGAAYGEETEGVRELLQMEEVGKKRDPLKAVVPRTVRQRQRGTGGAGLIHCVLYSQVCFPALAALHSLDLRQLARRLLELPGLNS